VGGTQSAGISERYRDHYAGYCPAPSEWFRVGALAKAVNLTALCADVPHESVLEVGSGEGSLLARVADLGFARELHAVDVSERSIAAVASRELPGLVRATAYDGVALPYEDQSVDLVVLSHVVEHLEHPRILLYEAARVGRHVFVEVPLEDHWRMPHDFTFDATGHINFYDARSIRRLDQSAGLEVLGERVATPSREGLVYQHGAAGNARYWVKELARRIAAPLAMRIWTYHGALLCRPVDSA
jgi:SAM-dependent methyltransferase